MGGSDCGRSWWWLTLFDVYKSKSTNIKSSFPFEEFCRHFSLAEIRTATNNFDDAFIIGMRNYYTKVYKGYIDGGERVVAIKRMNPERISKLDLPKKMRKLEIEIETLSQLHHHHLVSLVGYCNDKNEMILVYDYMINGSLCYHLYGTNNNPLPWKQRLLICIDAAKGLQYLHSGNEKQKIIHRNVKTANILLDERWVAKVSDFGLSRMGKTTNCEMVVGTTGILAPEYAMHGELTEKSDVYLFGAVLFEVLCARPVDDDLIEEVEKYSRDDSIDQIIDPYLIGYIASNCLKEFVTTALSCCRDNGTERPTMGHIVESLQFALKLQENADAPNRISF